MQAIKSLVTAGVAAALVSFVACGGGGETGAEGEAGGQESQMRAQPAETGGQMAERQAQEKAAGEQQAAELPEGVTPEMIEQGKAIFAGDGLCYACHGQDAKGLPNLGADLTDGEWTHIDGSYQSIIENIQTGVTAQESTSGTPMPPKGGSSISEEQVEAVAAYVWSLSQQ